MNNYKFLIRDHKDVFDRFISDIDREVYKADGWNFMYVMELLDEEVSFLVLSLGKDFCYKKFPNPVDPIKMRLRRYR